MIFGLPDNTVAKMRAVFSKYPHVEKVMIYGSRAMGNYKNGSDIDLTMFGDSITERDRRDIFFELDNLPIPYMVDLSIFSKLNHEDLEAHIRRVGQIFYERVCLEE
jgi:predicted nucleotidyltransferase